MIGVRRKIIDRSTLEVPKNVDFYISYLRYDLTGVQLTSRPARVVTQPMSARSTPSQVSTPHPVSGEQNYAQQPSYQYSSFQPSQAQFHQRAPYAIPQPNYSNNEYKDMGTPSNRASNLSSSAPAWGETYGAKVPAAKEEWHQSSHPQGKFPVSAPARRPLVKDNVVESEEDDGFDDIEFDYAAENKLRAESIPVSRANLKEELINAAIENMTVPNPLDSGPVPTGIPELDEVIFGYSHYQGVGMTPSLVDHVIGRVCMLAKSQGGSRFIQQKIIEGEILYFQIFFQEMKLHTAELMCDKYGFLILNVIYF